MKERILQEVVWNRAPSSGMLACVEGARKGSCKGDVKKHGFEGGATSKPLQTKYDLCDPLLMRPLYNKYVLLIIIIIMIMIMIIIIIVVIGSSNNNNNHNNSSSNNNNNNFDATVRSASLPLCLSRGLRLRPISLLRLSLLRFIDPRFP